MKQIAQNAPISQLLLSLRPPHPSAITLPFVLLTGAGLTQVQAECFPWQAQWPAQTAWRGSRAGGSYAVLASVIGRIVILLEALMTEPCPSHSQSPLAPTSYQVTFLSSLLTIFPCFLVQ